MILTTTDGVDGYQVSDYLGIVSGEAIIGAHLFKDLFASIRDIVGGRAGAYEDTLREAKEHAIDDLKRTARQMGADAVLAIDLDYEVLGGSGSSMLMVTANGTAVRLTRT